MDWEWSALLPFAILYLQTAPSIRYEGFKYSIGVFIAYLCSIGRDRRSEVPAYRNAVRIIYRFYLLCHWCKISLGLSFLNLSRSLIALHLELCAGQCVSTVHRQENTR
jgi:hypothetical protein